jgi:nicotinamidase/pyrazinamidase
MALAKDTALLVVDVQNDFCPGGNLGVRDGDRIVPVINELISKFQIVIGTQDWHPANHGSFASNNNGADVYSMGELNGIAQVMWPDHCVQGTSGAEFHSSLNSDAFCAVIRKGTTPSVDSYSAFQENDRKTKTGLSGLLRELGVNKLYVTGIATDFCVKYSALDAVAEGFEVLLIEDACKGVDLPVGSVLEALEEMQRAGIKVIKSSEL